MHLFTFWLNLARKSLAHFKKKNLGNSLFCHILRRPLGYQTPRACAGYVASRDYRLCKTVFERTFACRNCETSVSFTFNSVAQAHAAAISGTAILAVGFPGDGAGSP
jgi:hypothetical protein